MHNDALIVFTTTDNQIHAQSLATMLVSEKLAACVNILPQAESIYMWQGKVESANEFVLKIKTTPNHYPALERLIKQQHHYETPEVIAIPATHISNEYLAWLVESVN